MRRFDTICLLLACVLGTLSPVTSSLARAEGGERASPGDSIEIRAQPGANQPRAIPPPGKQSSRRLATPGKTAESRSPELPGPVTVAGSLALVLGLFFLVTWCFRRGMPSGSGMLPTEVVQVLGRASLAPRQNVHLLRCGNKLLLISVSAGGAETLTEITDPAEVDRLAGICQQTHPDSSTTTFRNVLEQIGGRRRTGPHGKNADGGLAAS